MQANQRTMSAWHGLLLLVVGAIFAWIPGSNGFSGLTSSQAEITHADDPFQDGAVQVAPSPPPAQDEIETLSEEAEDPLVALGAPHLGLELAPEGEAGEHGSIVGWAVCAPTFPSSTARGPPRV